MHEHPRTSQKATWDQLGRKHLCVMSNKSPREARTRLMSPRLCPGAQQPGEHRSPSVSFPRAASPSCPPRTRQTVRPT